MNLNEKYFIDFEAKGSADLNVSEEDREEEKLLQRAIALSLEVCGESDEEDEEDDEDEMLKKAIALSLAQE